MAYLLGPLCFLTCDNKGLGGSNDGHARSPFFPASKQSCCLLLKTDTGLTFCSPLQLFWLPRQVRLGVLPQSGVHARTASWVLRGLPTPSCSEGRRLQAPPTSSSVSTEEKSSSQVPRMVQGQAGLQKQHLYLQKPRVWLVTAEVTPLSPLVDLRVAPSLPRILQVQVHRSFC